MSVDFTFIKDCFAKSAPLMPLLRKYVSSFYFQVSSLKLEVRLHFRS